MVLLLTSYILYSARADQAKVSGKVLKLSALLLAQVSLYRVKNSGYQSLNRNFMKLSFLGNVILNKL
jgi:hypothetical protein